MIEAIDRMFTTNAMGRSVPGDVNGRATRPFEGLWKDRPTGRKAAPLIRSCQDYPTSGDKRTSSIREALQKAGLRDGMVLSTHHHLRDGDHLALQLFKAAEELGVRDLTWFPSATFPCHAALIPLIESGVISRIEGSLNGPLGDFASSGGLKNLAVLRSHGGRFRAIQDGDVTIDIAVLAAPSADSFGNCSGVHGPSACGPLGFALADSQYAEHVIAVTDHLVEFPCVPWHIQGNHVDQVVCVDSIGDPSKIVSGTTQVTRSPERLLIASYAAQFAHACGIVKDGFSFQAGAGGISLAFVKFLSEIMKEGQVKARFVRGGSTGPLVKLLQDGYAEYILDGQSFDLDGVRSLRDDPRHIATSPFTSYSYHNKGNVASMVDCAVLGATEVDLNFNANVATHSDGKLLHGLGGWSDALFSGCTILTLPLIRGRVPTIREKVTTLCGPGELVDAVVTERGIAVNPLRQDLLERLAGSELPIRTLSDLKAEAESICGCPATPELTDDLVGVVEWVDGSIIDSIFKPRTLEGPRKVKLG